MQAFEREPGQGRLLTTLAFVFSAALAAASLRFAWSQPLVAAAVLAGALAVLAVRWLSRRRLHRLLRSGDVDTVLERWSPAIDRVPHAATMGPLMTATAFAAYGWVERARAALAAAERGPAWEAALEHRLFLDAMLLTFEGDREAAREQAERLTRLPLPAAAGPMRTKVAMLREAVAALVRAFAHTSAPCDGELLERASDTSPLVHWAMRYGAAIVAIDQGDNARARKLLEAAPPWPAESAFRAFHDELSARC